MWARARWGVGCVCHGSGVKPELVKGKVMDTINACTINVSGFVLYWVAWSWKVLGQEFVHHVVTILLTIWQNNRKNSTNLGLGLANPRTMHLNVSTQFIKTVKTSCRVAITSYCPPQMWLSSMQDQPCKKPSVSGEAYILSTGVFFFLKVLRPEGILYSSGSLSPAGHLVGNVQWQLKAPTCCLWDLWTSSEALGGHFMWW